MGSKDVLNLVLEDEYTLLKLLLPVTVLTLLLDALCGSQFQLAAGVHELWSGR